MNPRDPLLDSQPRERRIVRVLRERWYVVVLVAVSCLAGAMAISLTSPRKYQATSRLLFQQDSFGAALFGNNVFQSGTDPARTAGTNVDEVTSLDVAQQVNQTLKLHQSPQGLLDSMTASSETNADIVDISVQNTDPNQAAAIATAWASAFVALRKQQDRNRIGQAIADMQGKLDALPITESSRRSEYQQQLAKLEALQAVQFGNVQALDSATVPNSPVSPRPTRDGIVGLLLGLVLGGGIAVLLDALDRRIKSVDALEAVYELPVIGLVPSRAFKPRTEGDRRRAIEAFRAVREGLSVFAVSSSSPVFVVTSAIAAEGKTTVAINLARVLAMSGERVMLIEADLRRPSLGLHTGKRGSREGLTSALLHDVPLRELVVSDRTGLEKLQIIPSGASVPFAAELLRSPKMDALLDEARELADVVILDAPPLLPVADARSLIKLPSIDGVLLVARLYAETTEQAKRVRALLEQHSIDDVRVIATSTPEEPAYGYDEEYGGTGPSSARMAAGLGSQPVTEAPPAQPLTLSPLAGAAASSGPGPAQPAAPAPLSARPRRAMPTPASPADHGFRPPTPVAVAPNGAGSLGSFRPVQTADRPESGSAPPTSSPVDHGFRPTGPAAEAPAANDGAARKPVRPFSPTGN